MGHPEVRLLEVCLQIVRRYWTHGIHYGLRAMTYGDPIITRALQHYRVLTNGAPLGEEPVEAVTPTVMGRYFLMYSTDVPTLVQETAIRHGLAHIAAGHVDYPPKIEPSVPQYMTHHERVADVLALIDLIPTWVMRLLRDAQLRTPEIRAELSTFVGPYTHGWPADRLADRISLRTMIYLAHAI